AFAKAWLGANHQLPQEGTAFVSVHDRDKGALLPVARRLSALGFRLIATQGTAAFLRDHGLDAGDIQKVHQGRPHIVDELINGGVQLVVNTPLGRESHQDDAVIRQTALKYDIPCITTLSGAMAAAEAIAALKEGKLSVEPLQELVG
ncbi:MAG: carbamoyl phosphate synthase large subunit, partial [Acidobacteriota bacterium]